MALMQSCCCWRSVRRGSFACASYTGIYFALLAVTTGMVLKDEQQYMWGNRSMPESLSVLEPGNMSHVTVGFNVSLFVCSCFGFISSLLLFFGLFKDRRSYLLPWIINVIACCLIDVIHTFYLFSSQGFEPINALVHTLDFFLLCLNVYSLLCVISQYQEYAAGRGRAIDDCEQRIPAIRYAVQPTTTTATSCLSSRRTTTTNNETKGTSITVTGSASPSQSPIVPHQQTIITTLLDKTIVSTGSGKTVRKHVQFPDQTTPDSNTNQGISTDDISIAPEDLTNEKEITLTGASSLLSPPRIALSQSQQQRQQQSTRNEAES